MWAKNLSENVTSRVFTDGSEGRRTACAFGRPVHCVFAVAPVTRHANCRIGRRLRGMKVYCTAQVDQESSASAVPVDKPTRGLLYTAYEGNSWAAEFCKTGIRILVDPWLVDELVFFNQTWLYRGRKGALPPVDVAQIGEDTDVIIISQGLDDHAHVPTLKQLPKEKPLVGSPSACRIAASLGFKNVYELQPGQSIDLCNGRIRIRATAGALVGPPWSKREAGFIISEVAEGGTRLYYEPHCDYEEASFRDVDAVDALVSPVVSQLLVSYPLVMGSRNLVGLAERLKPKVIIPLVNAEFIQEGPLSFLLRAEGSLAELEGKLKAAGLPTTVLPPGPPGQPVPVPL
eukprot:jgi/Botrbrau1/19012/Bobra.0100s0044.1